MTTPRTPTEDRLASWGLTTPLRRDAALAGLVALFSAVLMVLLVTTPQLVGEPSLSGLQVVVAIVVLGAGSALLCVRRVVPVSCLLVTVLLQIAGLVVVPAGGQVHGPASVIAAYTCGALLAGRRAAALVVACAVGEAVAFLVRAVAVWPGSGDPLPLASALPLTAGMLFVGGLLYGLAALAGATAATRRRYVELVAVRAEEAVEAQRVRADAAVRQERARMARELHDVAAHHLSGMVVQAAVVERLVDRDPDAARRTAAAVRRQGRETLRDLRMIVGALRDPTEETDGAATPADGADPVPGLAELDRLVAAVTERGTSVELVRDGPAPQPPPIADVTFYRVAQEALTNAREHAPGAAVRMTLRHRPDRETSLEVCNGASPTGPPSDPPDGRRGYGLVGMRERAQLIGATFDAGPTPSGGWTVRMSLPDTTEELT